MIRDCRLSCRPLCCLQAANYRGRIEFPPAPLCRFPEMWVLRKNIYTFTCKKQTFLSLMISQDGGQKKNWESEN